MAGKTYVTKGYSTHTNIPVPQNGYDHGPKNRGNQYTAAGLTNFVGSPSKADLLKEYVHAPSLSKTPISSPPKYHGRSGNISGSNKSWQSAGPPATNHPLTGPTNNINEALGFLEESVYYSPRADPRRRGVLDELSTRAQPIEPLRRYARPAFVAKPNA